MAKKSPGRLRPCRCSDPDREICSLIFFSELISPYRYCQISGDNLLKEHDFAALLSREGWHFLRQKGHHQTWENEEGIRRTLAWPHDDSPPRSFLKALLKKFQIPTERLFPMPATKRSQEIKDRFIEPRNGPPAPNTLGHLIYTGRKRGDMSRQALGELLGVTRGAVGFWEGNKTTPEPVRLQQMADLFGWTEDEMRVIKGLSDQIIIKQTTHLPSDIENVIESVSSEPLPRPSTQVYTETLGPELIHPEPKPVTERPEIPAPMPASVPEPSVVVLEPVVVINASLVADYVRRLEMENLDLKDRLGKLEAMGDLDMLYDKARKYDRLKEIMGQ